MKSETILQSNLLDIIFENRNKDYGAYVLRKQYNHRLTQAMFAMMGCVLFFSILQVFKGGTSDQFFVPAVNGPGLMTIPPTPKPPETHTAPASRPRNDAERTPVIVKTTDSIIHVKEFPIFTDAGHGIVDGPPADLPGAGSGGIPGGKDSGSVKAAPIEKPIVDKTIPIESYDIAPQYPGGLNQLLKFLKSNLQSPNDLETEVMVKVRFVVNYDGTLVKFDVTQSGGEVFDKEVVRVLKKMPKWIPGKSKGDNVSVWFTVPVKFTPSE
jgi:protein TonB